eukprot:tig00020704_g13179.t1
MQAFTQPSPAPARLRSSFLPTSVSHSSRPSSLQQQCQRQASRSVHTGSGRRSRFEPARAEIKYDEKLTVEDIAREDVARAGDGEIGFASRLVSGLLGIKPLWEFAKVQARKKLINSAMSVGVDWIAEVEKMRQHDWDAEMAKLKLSDVEYPEYFLKPFHAYDTGNMNWEAAFEQELALVAIGTRDFPGAGTKGVKVIRESYHRLLRVAYGMPDASADVDPTLDPVRGLAQGAPLPRRIVDLGCGTGMSAIGLAEVFPDARVTGVDLSPYFLAAANYRLDRCDPSVPRGQVEFIHANAETTGLPSGEADLVTLLYTIHELPRYATTAILGEARRLLKPGGLLLIADQNPTSEAYAQMSPAAFTVFKATEPWMGDYFSWTELPEAIEGAGFTKPARVFTSRKHHAMLMRAL